MAATPMAAAPMAATTNLVIMRAMGRIIHRVGEVVTVTGVGVLVTGVLAWVAGWLLGWQELMVIAASCLMAFAIGALFTVGRLGVDVTTALVPDRVVVGHLAQAQVMVRNASGRRVFPLTVEVTVGSGVAALAVPGLGRAGEHDESFAVPTDRRAVIEVGPVRSLRSDPLHLVRRSVVWPRVRRLYVHPRTVALDRFWAGVQRDLEGHSTDDTSANDVELHTLRDYVPGDDRRLVHWRTSARTGRLMVRQTVDTRQSAHRAAVVRSGRGLCERGGVRDRGRLPCLPRRAGDPGPAPDDGPGGWAGAGDGLPPSPARRRERGRSHRHRVVAW